MENIQDDSIKRLTEVVGNQLVIPATGLREPGNMFEVGEHEGLLKHSWVNKDDIIFIYTIDSTEGQYLHYSLGNVNDLTKWKPMGRLPIFTDKFARTTYAQLEDGFLEYNAEEEQLRLYAEDKGSAGWTICMWYVFAKNWNYKTNTMVGNTIWDGGKTVIAPINPLGGVYSYASCVDNGKHLYFYESRETSQYTDISIVYGGDRRVVLPHNDKWQVMVSDYIHKVTGEYVTTNHGCTRYNPTWHSFLAITDNLLSEWKILNVIKLPEGNLGDLIPVYTDKWYYFYNSPEGMRLGIAKGDSVPDEPVEPPIEPPVDDDVPSNNALMREAKIELDLLEKNIIQTFNNIRDLVDEIR